MSAAARTFFIEDVSLYIFRFLSFKDIVAVGATNRHFMALTGNNLYWKSVCFEELYIKDANELPPGLIAGYEETSYRVCFLSWIKSFHGYNLADVKAVRRWWQQFESWCAEMASPILQTLLPPVTEQQLSQIEGKLAEQAAQRVPPCAFRIPTMLRLFYRFHNGQRCEPRNSMVTENQLGYGLFGGTNFYDYLVCMQLLPLVDVLQVTLLVWDQVAGSVSHPPLSVFSSVDDKPFCLRSNADKINFLSRYPRTRIEDCVVFSSNTVHLSKFYCLGPDVGGTEGGGVFVNNAECELTPCHDMAEGLTASRPTPNYFLSWLQEYLRRLQTNVYRYTPLELADEVAVTSLEISSRPHMISLFPVAPLYDAAHGPDCDTSSQFNFGATQCVGSDGAVEVTACPAFIPERTSVSRLYYTWAYSIRLRLLNNASLSPPSSPLMNSCQLTHRHWEIYEPHINGGSSPNTEYVSGEAVVGLRPILSLQRTNQSNWPFAYQSCCTATSFPGSFKGSIEFVPGCLESAGAPFLVPVGEFSLAIPAFIY